MRSLNPDTEYFKFLDSLRVRDDMNTTLAPVYLIREFPNLRSEEAKAVCADWRARCRERHLRIKA